MQGLEPRILKLTNSFLSCEMQLRFNELTKVTKLVKQKEPFEMVPFLYNLYLEEDALCETIKRFQQTNRR